MILSQLIVMAQSVVRCRRTFICRG